MNLVEFFCLDETKMFELLQNIHEEDDENILKLVKLIKKEFTNIQTQMESEQLLC